MRTKLQFAKFQNVSASWFHAWTAALELQTKNAIEIMSWFQKSNIGDLQLRSWKKRRQQARVGHHFNFVCTGVCGHTIRKLTHPQTKADPSINKSRPIPRLCTIKHEPKLAKLQQVLFNFTKTTHSQVELLKWRPVYRSYVLELWPIRRCLGRNLHPSAGFWASKTHPFWPHIPSMTQNGTRKL